jgi:hypothetical protein
MSAFGRAGGGSDVSCFSHPGTLQVPTTHLVALAGSGCCYFLSTVIQLTTMYCHSYPPHRREQLLQSMRWAVTVMTHDS